MGSTRLHARLARMRVAVGGKLERQCHTSARVEFQQPDDSNKDERPRPHRTGIQAYRGLCSNHTILLKMISLPTKQIPFANHDRSIPAPPPSVE